MLITRNVQKPIETISRRSSQCFCWRTFLIVDIIPRGRQSFAVGEIVRTAVRVMGSNREKYLGIMFSMTMMIGTMNMMEMMEMIQTIKMIMMIRMMRMFRMSKMTMMLSMLMLSMMIYLLQNRSQ